MSKPTPTLDRGDLTISPYALLRRRGGSTLVVALAGANQEEGRYAYYKSFTEFDALLVNCPANEWFCNGVPFGAGEHRLDETIAYIGKLAKDYDKLVFLGGSMGAYGAILFASFFPESVAIAMGPEIYAGLRAGFFNTMNQVSTIPFNLSALFARGSVDPYILVGEKKGSDMFGLVETKSERVLSMINCYHQIVPILRNVFGSLEGLVKSILAGTHGEALAGMRGSYGAQPVTIAVSYFCEIGALPVAEAIGHLDRLGDGYFRSYLCTTIASRLREANDWRGAMDSAERAIAYNPADLENHLLHASCHFRLYGKYPVSDWHAYQNPLFKGVPLYDKSVASLSEWMPAGPRPVASPTALASVARADNAERRDRHLAILADAERAQADVVLLGDSIFARMAGRPRDQRSLALWQHYAEDRRIYNLGVGGDRIANIHWRITHGEIDGMAPRLLLVRAGVNDLLFDETASAADVAGRILSLVEILLQALPVTKIVVLSLLPSTYPQIERGRGAVNAILGNAIPASGNDRLAWLDGEHLLRDDEGKLMREWFAEHRPGSTGDELLLHPNVRGYRRLFAQQERLIASALGQTPRRPPRKAADG